MNKDRIFYNEYQKQLFIDSKKERIKIIDNKIKKLQEEKQMWLLAISEAYVGESND